MIVKYLFPTNPYPSYRLFISQIRVYEPLRFSVLNRLLKRMPKNYRLFTKFLKLSFNCIKSYTYLYLSKYS